MKKFFFLSLVAFLFVQCGQKKMDEAKSYAVESAYSEAAPAMEAPADMSDENRSTQAPVDPVDQKIIKTGYFTFETASVSDTYNQVKKSVETQKGYIQNDQSTKSYDRLTRTLTIRIPNTGFQPVIDSLSKKVEVFDEQRVELEDVTEEFYDIEARTKAKKELETRYLQLLSKAGNIKDMLEIERQLATIREEIEAQEGRLKYLQNRVSYSTINLTFYEINESKNAPSNSFFARIGKGLKGGFNGIQDFIVILFYNWPIFMFLFFGFWFYRKWKAKKRKVLKQDN